MSEHRIKRAGAATRGQHAIRSADRAPAPGSGGPIAVIGQEELQATSAAASPRRNILREAMPPAMVFILFLLAWAGYRTFVLDRFKRRIVPLPWTVLQKGFTTAGASKKNPSELITGVKITTQVAVTGLVIATTVGVMLAVLMSTRKWVENSVYPYAVALQTIPIIAIAPIINIILGSGLGARIFTCVVISIFPIIINTLFGLKSADAGQHDLFTLHDAGFFTRLFKLQFPAALPSMFEGFRISAGLSVIGAIVGEFFFSQGPRGLGILIDIYKSRGLYNALFAAIILSSMLGLVVFFAVTWLRKIVIGRWYQAAR